MFMCYGKHVANLFIYDCFQEIRCVNNNVVELEINLMIKNWSPTLGAKLNI